MLHKNTHFYEFEDFHLDAVSPSLWRGDQLVPIAPKALELLILLVKKNGEIVSRDEVLESVWKDTFVEEGNINYTISLIRKVFENKDVIKTIPRHGYRFTSPIIETSGNGDAPAVPAASIDPALNKVSRRWVLGSALLFVFLAVTGFAYVWTNRAAVKAPNPPAAENVDALHFYQRGKMILENRTVENREEKAIDEFQKAVAADPALAIAHAGLAEGFTSAGVRFSGTKGRDAVAKAKTSAEKALALDPNLAEGYAIRGWLKRNTDWDWPGAESDLRRAIELSPNVATSHQRLAQTLIVTGKQDEALDEINEAYRIDPVSDIILSSRFPILEARGEYETGVKESAELLRENKENNNAARAYATFLYHKQDFAQVIEIGEMTMAKGANKTAFAWLSLLAAAYQKTGQPEKADESLKQLEALSQSDSKPLFSLAMNYAELGHSDEAIAALERCFETREERMVWLNVEPRFANLRHDERFTEILKKMKLK